jgi:signal peptidase I
MGRSRARRIVREGAVSKAFLSVLLLWLPLACSSNVRPLLVIGSSMVPSLQPGQLVLLHRDYYRTHPLRRGEIVAFRWQGHTYVKRVYALRGDTVPLVSDGEDWFLIPTGTEPSLKRLHERYPWIQLRHETIRPGYFFCLGDNRNASLDSRDLGPIPISAILGRAQSLSASGRRA